MNRSKIEVRGEGKQLTRKQIERLRQLKESAARARGAYYSQEIANDSQKFTELLLHHLENGVSYATLAEATGLKWRSIKSRLARHGQVYDVPPSQRAKRFQGPKPSGPQCGHPKERWRERVSKKTGKVTHVECLDCRRNKRAEKLAQS